MKILIFGRGVIGALYGKAFEDGGHVVEFFVRPGRAAAYGPILPLRFYDTRVKAMGTLVEDRWPITMREEIPVDHDYDLIIVSVQHQVFADAVAALNGRAGKAMILIFNNFWNDPQQQVRALPAEQLAWGFPAAGGAFDDNGLLHGGLLKQVQFGTFGMPPTKSEKAVRELFANTGFKLNEHEDFRSWLWIHFAANAGVHLQALRANSVKDVFERRDQARGTVLNVRELIPVLQARGVDTNVDAGDLALYKMPPGIGALALNMAVRFFPPMRESIAFNSIREELRTFCRDVLFEARRLRVPVPRFEASASLFESAPA